MGSRYVCSTAVADLSAVAAARVIRPSSRSPRGRCRGRSASPNRARSSPRNIRKQMGRRNLEILAAASLEATLLQPDQAAPREEYLAAMEELSNHAYRAYRNL